MRKVIWWIISIFILSGIGFRIWESRQRQRITYRREDTVTPVAVTQPRTGGISSTLLFIGNIKGEDQVQVFSEAPGKLIRYTVNEGDRVNKDQVIALVDRSITGMEFEPVRVKSPLSGVIGKLFLDQGSSIALQLPVAMVVKMDRVKAVFNIGEKDLAKVRKGMVAEIKVDLYPDEVFKGTVTRISPVIDPLSRTALCEVLIPNPKHKLKPGAFAEIDLVVESHKSTILLPRDAVICDLEKNIYYLFVAEAGNAVKKEIEIGITASDTVEIKSGITSQDKIIIKGQHYLKGGEKIEIID
ncbi:MAG: efflux RND transporter periplasmic adaptor subunit [candidate division WOR-3 bacterium]|nr:efflux RND transporter periplasmic adaptor subunit [candidate division WOR-3 bacterium]